MTDGIDISKLVERIKAAVNEPGSVRKTVGSDVVDAAITDFEESVGRELTDDERDAVLEALLDTLTPEEEEAKVIVTPKRRRDVIDHN